MLKIEKSIVIDAPLEEVFAYSVDPAHIQEFWTGVDEVKDIRRLPDGRYTFTAVNKILGLRAEGKTEQIKLVPNERFETMTHSPIMDIALSTRFERLGGGKTRLSGVSEYTFHGPLTKLGDTFLAKFFDHAAEMTLVALKARIEAGIPTATAR